MAKAKFTAEFRVFEADDVRAFYDAHAVRVWHLRGKDRVFRIARVEQVVERFGKETKTKAALWLTLLNGEPVSLPFVLNPTNRDTIRGLYGNKPSGWAGKQIQLYPTTTDFGGKTVDCIRVRNTDPSLRQQQGQTRTNHQGVHVLQQQPAQQQQAPADDGPSGLELDPDALDEIDRQAGNLTAADFGDPTDDGAEPPLGALETDRVIQ